MVSGNWVGGFRGPPKPTGQQAVVLMTMAV